MTKFYFDQNGALLLGQHILTPGTIGASFVGTKVIITKNGNGETLYSGEITNLKFKNQDGSLVACTGIDNFIEKTKDFFVKAPIDAGAVIYGVERLRNSADPQFTPIGNLGYHLMLPIHSLRKIVKVNAAREIAGTLKQTDINYNEDGTASVLDGSDGCDVMVYNPPMWAVLDGAGSSGAWERWIIANRPFTYDGDSAIEIKAYVDAADNATLESGVNKLRCIRNETAGFAGSGSVATAGGLGYPRTSISRYNMELYAQNKGDKWKGTYYRDHLVEAALMYIEYKTKNLKSIFGSLGTGWSSANWTAYNGTNPVLKVLEAHVTLSGRADVVGKGHLTGTFDKVFNFDNAGTPVVQTTKFGCYRGKVLRNGIWNHICGIEYEIQSVADGGLSKVWIQNNPDLIDANRSDVSFAFRDTYTYRGNAARTEGWSRGTIPGTAQAGTIGGAETTFDCKYHYTNIPALGTSRRCVLEGGSLSYGSNVAFGSSLSYSAPSSAFSPLGVGFRADMAG